MSLTTDKPEDHVISFAKERLTEYACSSLITLVRFLSTLNSRKLIEKLLSRSQCLRLPYTWFDIFPHFLLILFVSLRFIIASHSVSTLKGTIIFAYAAYIYFNNHPKIYSTLQHVMLTRFYIFSFRTSIHQLGVCVFVCQAIRIIFISSIYALYTRT